MRRSLSIGGSSSVQWRKVGRSWRLQMCFLRLLCVRIEIDQLQCVNCWVIIHCLSVSCIKINHSGCALVIWSSLQMTPKQWIITQQFTAGADLFLKYILRKGFSNFQIKRFTCWTATAIGVANVLHWSKWSFRLILNYVHLYARFFWWRHFCDSQETTW